MDQHHQDPKIASKVRFQEPGSGGEEPPMDNKKSAPEPTNEVRIITKNLECIHCV